MFVGGPHENHYVVELSDGSFARFLNTPFRKIEEKDLEPLHTYTAKGNRAEEVPEDLLKCYGLEKEKETRTVNVHFRFKPSIKSAAEKAAEKKGVSLSRYVEGLIEKDITNAEGK